MPSFGFLYTDIATRIQNFYEQGSILVDNKYIVGLYGENVGNAVKKMLKGAKSTPKFTGQNDGIFIPTNTYELMFHRWKKAFVTEFRDDEEIDLRWTVSNVTIPMVKATTVKDFSMDSTKNLWYPIITGPQVTDKITMTIVEERGMGMYQFFNALMNTFFTTQMLKPKSSFQKLAMYIIVLNGEYIEHKIEDKKAISIIDIPLQLFEFNSIVPVAISPLKFKQADKADKVTFTVDFEAPNIFQEPYKSVTLRGLRDNSTDDVQLKTNPDGTTGEYNEKAFTLEASELKTEGNGWFPDEQEAPEKNNSKTPPQKKKKK